MRESQIVFYKQYFRHALARGTMAKVTSKSPNVFKKACFLTIKKAFALKKQLPGQQFGLMKTEPGRVNVN
jgi:hypothetical protein